MPLGAARFGLSGVKAEDLVWIQTQSPSGVSDIDFTSISEGKFSVHFVTYTLKPASDNETLGCRFFESGTLESSSVYVEGHMETLSQGNNEDSNAQIHYRSTGRDHIRVGENTGNSTGEGGSGYFYIHNAGDSNLMTSLTNQNAGLNNSNNILRGHGGGTLPQTSTVDGFRIFGKNNGGNLTGKVTLYGVSI